MLDKYRSEIDQLDDQIITLLNKRFEVTSQVGKYKRENQIAILNSQREQAIISKIKQLNLSNQSAVVDTYQALIEISKRYQDE